MGLGACDERQKEEGHKFWYDTYWRTGVGKVGACHSSAMTNVLSPGSGPRPNGVLGLNANLATALHSHNARVENP